MITGNKPIAGGTYMCNQGLRYLVYGVSKHVETGEEVVVYEPVYTHNKIIHCSLDAFMEEGKFTLIKRPVELMD